MKLLLLLLFSLFNKEIPSSIVYAIFATDLILHWFMIWTIYTPQKKVFTFLFVKTGSYNLLANWKELVLTLFWWFLRKERRKIL